LAHRRRGYGHALVRGMLGWAAERGARHAYLQVVAANTPARRLYAGLGFREVYRYWYRILGA
jgi:N-acetylglutamate synthase